MAKPKVNPWANLSPDEKKARVANMLENRAKNRGGAVKSRPALPTEIQRVSVSAPHTTPNGAVPQRRLDDLAQLIVAIWRNL